MTKADIVNEIAKNTGVDKTTVLTTVEAFMEAVKASLSREENVYLRGFGSFVVKKRAQKTARNISKNTSYEKDAFLHYLDLGPQFNSLEKYVKQTLSDKKKKRHKMSTHKRKKRLRKNRHKSKK